MPLTSKTPIETFIRDFIKSDNSRLVGKSPEKLRQMAIAAYYAKHEDKVISFKEYIMECKK